jgi:N-acetylglucosaminyldiphosphoundecaprenol N-acetyl-beta-D-mannosaminyltransferase
MLALRTEKKRTCIQLLGTNVSLYSQVELMALMQSSIAIRKKITILSGNIHAFNLCYKFIWLRNFFNQADAVRLDGVGIRLAAFLLGQTTPERMTWADFAWTLASFSSNQRYSLYFLGAKPGIAEEARSRMIERHPELDIIGVHHGYFDKTPECRENQAVVKAINDAEPDILVLGFGMPMQEKWLKDNREKLNVPVVITGGAVFDYVSGNLKRAPSWMTKTGLEWFGRFLIEPGRLWKRYSLGNPLFFWRIFVHHMLGFPLPD